MTQSKRKRKWRRVRVVLQGTKNQILGKPIRGGIGNVRAYVQGSTDVVFVGGVKNVMTHSIVGGGNIKRPEDLRGKRVGVSRIGGNSHYFTNEAVEKVPPN